MDTGTNQAARTPLSPALERLLAAGPLAFVVLAPPESRYVSPNIEQLWGYRSDEVLSSPSFWLEQMPPEDRRAVTEAILADQGASASVSSVEFRFRCRDGRLRWFRSVLQTSTDLQMSGRQVVGYVLDIHDSREYETVLAARLEAEQAARERAEEAERLVQYQASRLVAQSEASPDGILVVDPEGRVVAHNRRFAEIWCIPPADLETSLDSVLLGSVQRLLADPDRFNERVRYLYQHRDEHSEEEIALTDGRTLERHSSPIRGQDGEHFGRVWFFRDITVHKRLQEELKDLYSQAQDAVRDRDRFLALAAHELKTPITGIRGHAELFARYAERGQLDLDRLTRHSDRILRSAKRLSQISSDLLDIAQIRTGQLTIRKEPVTFSLLVDQLVTGQRDQLDSNRHKLRLDLQDRDLIVHADPGRIEQVISNLLDNAVRYSPNGGTIRITLKRDADEAVLTVRDDGIGLPAGSSQAIFEPFGRADNALTAQIQGLGLGLHICRQIVAAHGGTLSAASAGEGMGTTVSLRLPTDGRPTTDD